jgi:hypothetical protein
MQLPFCLVLGIQSLVKMMMQVRKPKSKMLQEMVDLRHEDGAKA